MGVGIRQRESKAYKIRIGDKNIVWNRRKTYSDDARCNSTWQFYSSFSRATNPSTGKRTSVSKSQSIFDLWQWYSVGNFDSLLTFSLNNFLVQFIVNIWALVMKNIVMLLLVTNPAVLLFLPANHVNDFVLVIAWFSIILVDVVYVGIVNKVTWFLVIHPMYEQPMDGNVMVVMPHIS